LGNIKWSMSKEELIEAVWKIPIEELGRNLGVSGNAIRKRCKQEEIKVPPRGYWQKKQTEDSFPLSEVELRKLVMQMPIKVIARDYDVSTDRIRRMNKLWGITLPPNGTWCLRTDLDTKNLSP